MKLRSKFFYYLFFFCLFLAAIKGYDKITEGFYPARTYPKDIPSLTFSCEPSQEAIEALSQPYSYLSSGSQSFAFVSKDQKYVIKLFKHYRWEKPWYLSLLWIDKDKKRDLIKKKHEGKLATLQSCIYSFLELKEESGLIYLQVTPKKIQPKTLVVKNKLNLPFHIDLSKTTFALQYRAENIKDYLLECKDKNKHNDSKRLIDDLFSYILKRRQKKITDKDPHFLNNFGILNGNVISIDIGGLIKDPKKGEKYFYKKELIKAENRVLPWLSKHYPELEEYTRQKFSLLKSKSPQD